MMQIAITGGTGFVGRHLAARLTAEGHEVVAIARGTRHPVILRREDAEGPVDSPRGAWPTAPSPSALRPLRVTITDESALAEAFAGCDVVAHCAGINREIGEQTFARVHIAGTRSVVAAAKRAGVRKIILLSFLRARPDCGSPYHESKFAAEEIIRASGLDYTVIKAGMIYGRGDHMLDHLSHALHTLPIFATVGMREKPIRPLAIDDLVDILRAAIVDGRLSRQTVAVTGAEELLLSDAVRRVANVLGKRVLIVPSPLFAQYALAHIFEWTMKVPLVAVAQVRILAEGVVGGDSLPDDLVPKRTFTDDQIARGLPERGRFTLRDLRWCHA
jgi:NADH dehydrogenase